jgi:hypothetical protein
MKTLRIPLVGSITNRNTDPVAFAAKDQLFVNCYPEVTRNPITGKADATLNKRPGYVTGSALTGPTSATNALIVWHTSSATGPVGAFSEGGTSTSIWNVGTGTQIGADIFPTDICTAIHETKASGVAYLVANLRDSGTGVFEQWTLPEGGSWAQVVDSDFPTNIVGAPTDLDGYVFNLTDDGRLWNSDLNSVSTYTAGSFITANAHPDIGVSAARLGDKIAAFSQKSIEFFQNTGNPVGSPLSRIGSIQMGAARVLALADPLTVLAANDTVYWIGTNSDGAPTGVYRFKGLAPEKLSSPAIDKLIGAGDIIGFVGTLFLHGMNHVAVRGAAGVWCLCLDTGYWWKLVLESGEPRAIVAAPIQNSNAGGSYFIGTQNTRGNQFITDASSSLQDNGANFTMVARTGLLDLGTDKKKIATKLRVVYDTQTSTSNLGVSWSDDDFATSTTPINIDMSTSRNWITRLGTFRRRSLQFTNTAATPCRIQAIELEYDMGLS